MCGTITLLNSIGQTQVTYDNGIRQLMGYEKFCSVSGMFVKDRSDNFGTCIRRLVYGFYQRLIPNNSFLKCVLINSAWLSSKL